MQEKVMNAIIGSTFSELPLERAAPESVGVSSDSIRNFLSCIETHHLELHGIIICRNNKIITEGYWAPYSAKPHRIHSANKVTNMFQALLAIQEGYFSLDDRLCELMPEHMPDIVSERLSKMTVRHLLTMTTGHGRDSFQAIMLPEGEDRAKSFFSEPLPYEPGEYFYYDNGVPDILAQLCREKTGKTVIEYVGEKIWKPLGIESYTSFMNGDDTELPTAAMTLRDLFKYALFLYHGGEWDGKQIIRRELIQQAGKAQVPNDESTKYFGKHDRSGYGWQLWRNAFGGYRLNGGRSQLGVVLPEYDMIIAINAQENREDEIMDLLWEQLIRKTSEQPLKENRQAQDALQRKLCSLTLAPPKTALCPEVALICRTWKLDKPFMGITEITVSVEDSVTVTTKATVDDTSLLSNVVSSLTFKPDGQWYSGKMLFRTKELVKWIPNYQEPPTIAGADPMAVFVSASWKSPEVLQMHFRSDAWLGGYVIEMELRDKLVISCVTAMSWQYKTCIDYPEKNFLMSRFIEVPETAMGYPVES